MFHATGLIVRRRETGHSQSAISRGSPNWFAAAAHSIKITILILIFRYADAFVKKICLVMALSLRFTVSGVPV